MKRNSTLSGTIVLPIDLSPLSSQRRKADLPGHALPVTYEMVQEFLLFTWLNRLTCSCPLLGIGTRQVFYSFGNTLSLVD